MPLSPRRTGIRIRGHRGHPDVRDALIRYAQWLRREYDFPIRVPVYLQPGEYIIADGKQCSAAFFAPFNRNQEPFIRIATGDYSLLQRAEGRDNALASFIVSMSHEVVHYLQWLDTGDCWERGVARRAVSMLRRYEKTVERP